MVSFNVLNKRCLYIFYLAFLLEQNIVLLPDYILIICNIPSTFHLGKQYKTLLLYALYVLYSTVCFVTQTGHFSSHSFCYHLKKKFKKYLTKIIYTSGCITQ